MAGAGTVSHLQKAVLRIGNFLIVIAAVLVTVTTVVSLIRGNPALQTLEFALVVTIASVPVALPAVLAVTMAVGARQLARQQAVGCGQECREKSIAHLGTPTTLPLEGRSVIQGLDSCEGSF